MPITAQPLTTLALLIDNDKAQATAAQLTVLYVPVYVRLDDGRSVPRVLTKLPWEENGRYLCEVAHQIFCCSRVTIPKVN